MSELDDYMKRVPGGAPKGGGKPGETAAEPEDTGGDSGESTLYSVAAAPFRFAKSAAKGVISAAADLDPQRAVERFLPGGAQASAAREEARGPLTQWAKDDSDEGVAGSVGRFVGETAPYALIPGEFGLAARGARAMQPLWAAVRGPGGRMMRNPSWIAGAARQAAPYLAGQTGRTAERAAIGATVGAASDPESATRGAISGAAGAAAPGALGRLLQNPRVSSTASYIGQHVILGAGGHAMGIPWAFLAPFVWHWTPAGSQVHLLGQWLVDHTGRLIGHVPPQVAAHLSAQLTGAALGTGGGRELTQEDLDEAGVTQDQGADQGGGYPSAGGRAAAPAQR